MIRLKDILLEYDDSHESTMNVLFVVDDQALKKFGFARQLFSQGVIIGNIESAHEQNSQQLKNLVLANANPQLDLIVVSCRGIYDDNPIDILRNFDIIVEFCKTINVPVVFFGIPTTKFVKDKTKYSGNQSELERKKINNRISRLASAENYYIDLSLFNDDEYFAKDGIHLSLQGHYSLYEKLFDVILQIDPDAYVKRDISNIRYNLTDVQIKLKYLGYEINDDEITEKRIGDSTLKAVHDIAKILGYNVTETITNSLAQAILILTPERAQEVEKETISTSSCPNPKYPGARSNYAPENYTEKNGIKDQLNLITKKNVTLTKMAMTAYLKMLSVMKRLNIKQPETVASFRSYQTQYDIVDWDLYECEGIWKTTHTVMGDVADVAEPGTSDHGLGLAIDIDANRPGEAQEWIRKNGEAFGWVRNVPSEQWHFKFIATKVNVYTQNEIIKKAAAESE